MSAMFLLFTTISCELPISEDEGDIFMCDHCGHYESDSEGAELVLH